MDEVIHIHDDQIERYGGIPGIRDLDLLRSAISMPEAGFGDRYFHSDIFEMTATYLYHLVQNHPFLDGNKRVGAMAAFTFLQLNGHHLKAKTTAFETIIRKVAQGKEAKAVVAAFFRKHSQPQYIKRRILHSD